MDAGISLSVIWLDDDVLEVRVVATNGRFAAQADCYDSHDAIAGVAAVLRGFPTSVEDRREVSVGNLDPDRVKGGCRLALRCVNPTGDAVADVTVLSTDQHAPTETASFQIPVEAADIDRFVSDLSRIPLVAGSEATLRGRPN